MPQLNAKAPDPGAKSTRGAVSAFAFLTATALGSLVGARAKKVPLVLGVGAAAVALLGFRKKAESPTPLPSCSDAEASVSAQTEDFVREWLNEQEVVDAAAPVVLFLPLDESACAAAEDDYVPLSLLPEEEPSSRSAHSEDYARLTEPASNAPIGAQPAPSFVSHFAYKEAPTTSPPQLETPSFFGLEPMPSWSETPEQEGERLDPSDRPTHESVEDNVRVFEGGYVPDQFDVVSDPVEPITTQSTHDSASVIVEPDVTVPEINVEVTSAGGASFDPNPDPFPTNPWSSLVSPVEVDPPKVVPGQRVVEAEVILRPRAPVQNSVVPKTTGHFTRFSNPPPPEPAPQPPAEAPTLPPAPVVSTREQHARTTWRSWWKGD